MLARLLTAALIAFPLAAAPSSAEPVPAGSITFRSDFDTWDDRWQVDGGKRVVWVADGQLALGLEMTDAGWVRQARIDTQGSLDFRYGTYRARMRFNGPKGAHASAWAQSWHGSHCLGCSEIDTVEHFGGGSVWQTVWWPTADAVLVKQQTSTPLDPGNWHTYRVDWTPGGYTFYVDGEPRATFKDGLSDRPHFLILSYLIADWERDDLQRDRLGQYRAYVDWVEVKANAWTETYTWTD